MNTACRIVTLSPNQPHLDAGARLLDQNLLQAISEGVYGPDDILQMIRLLRRLEIFDEARVNPSCILLDLDNVTVVSAEREIRRTSMASFLPAGVSFDRRASSPS